MTVNITVPSLGESVTEATIGRWLKQVGDAVAQDEPLVELETDKVTLEVNAPNAGSLTEIVVPVGDNVKVGAIIGTIVEGAAGATAAAKPAAAKPDAAPQSPVISSEISVVPASTGSNTISPAAQKWAADNKVDTAQLQGSGKGGIVTKGDVIDFLKQAPKSAPASQPQPSMAGGRSEERVRMSRLRQRIAERLKSAQNEAAILTTFNEIDMSHVMALRAQYKDVFLKKHDIKLGFMGFFIMACINALKEIPAVNASIEGNEIVYKNYYDIGVAVGTPQGLVVPVIRNAETMGLADVEKQIADFGKRARDGKITLEELQGGTFTISNGGVYGSMMSTPILNPPQSGILGMHRTQDRAVVIDGKVEIRPMMYAALSYDHRIIDGREAVTFLVRVKECIEDPQRLLLAI
jgi:2-oxoglutarate dehydrogenase E2 component (dihydrolipoamide succinyltransferase)